MKKAIVIVSALGLLLSVNFAFARPPIPVRVNETISPIIQYILDWLEDLQQQVNSIELIPGPQGEQGPPGSQGEQGEQGLPGQSGEYFRVLGNGYNSTYVAADDKVYAIDLTQSFWEEVISLPPVPISDLVFYNYMTAITYDGEGWRNTNNYTTWESVGFIPNGDIPTSTPGIIQDNFESYSLGSIIGQGGWQEYANGSNFIVQNSIFNEGSQALYNNSTSDSVIYKSGAAQTDGIQSIYVRTENRDNWGPYEPDGNLQMRIIKNNWNSGIFAAISFDKAGNVAYYDPAIDAFVNFDTYNDNEWTLVEIEWRSSDNTARYRVNNNTWTDWFAFRGSGSFVDFDTIAFDFISPGGSGGVYIDTLY